MFEDIIGESTKKKEMAVFKNTDYCPYCGSEKIGIDTTYKTTRGTSMFCAVCGQSWLVS